MTSKYDSEHETEVASPTIHASNLPNVKEYTNRCSENCIMSSFSSTARPSLTDSEIYSHDLVR